MGMERYAGPGLPETAARMAVRSTSAMRFGAGSSPAHLVTLAIIGTCSSSWYSCLNLVLISVALLMAMTGLWAQ